MAGKVNLDFEAPISEMQKMLDKFKELQGNNNQDLQKQIQELETSIEQKRKEIYSHLSPWQTVQIARHLQRPVLQDYLKLIFTDFIELHGDRLFGDDRALIGGFCKLNKTNVLVVGHNKGKNIEENVERNFGQALPEGYRKALRLMKIAEKFNVPILAFVDTQGAFPGLDAEERGQAEAIARNLTEMARLEVPIICIVTGEGGSGGALGIAVGDIVLMLSHSVYSVISPEGCASILWKDASPSHSEAAAEALKITAPALKELGVIDEILPEPIGGAHTDPEKTAATIKEALERYLKQLGGISVSKLLNRRFDKFAKMGKFNKA